MASRSKKLAELNRNRIDLGRSPPAAFKRAKEEVMAHWEFTGSWWWFVGATRKLTD